MYMQAFDIKRGDTGPALRYALSPADVNIAGASVQFQMRKWGGDTVLDVAASIVTTSPPVVRHDWAAGQTDEMGLHQAEFRVTYADGSIETFPNKGFIAVSINEDVPNAAP